MRARMETVEQLDLLILITQQALLISQKNGYKGRSKLPIPGETASFAASISGKKTAVGPISPSDLLSLALEAPGISQRLTHSPGQTRVVLCPVESAAHSVLLAAISKNMPPKARLWVLGAPPRHRERLVDELSSWGCQALHLPPPKSAQSAELDDPEGEADRFTLFHELGRGAWMNSIAPMSTPRVG